MKENNIKKITQYSKKDRAVIEEAMRFQKITAYVKHEKTGALVPLDPDVAKKIADGFSTDIQEAERKYNRRYFKIKSLEKRWDLDSDEIVDKFMGYEVPLFIIPHECEQIDSDSVGVGREDICVFEEYVLAIEEKEKLKRYEVKSKYFSAYKN